MHIVTLALCTRVAGARLRHAAAHSRTTAVALTLMALAVPAFAAQPPPCAGVRFLAVEPLVPGSGVSFDAVVVDAAGDVTIESGCAATRVRVGKRGETTTLRARWTRCGALRSVRLNAKVDAACTTLGGTLVSRGKKALRFTAAPSTCGDGLLDTAAGESCETAADCGGEACATCVCGLEARAAGGNGKKKTTTTSTSTTSTSTRPTTSSSTSSSTSTSRPSTTTSSSSTSSSTSTSTATTSSSSSTSSTTSSSTSTTTSSSTSTSRPSTTTTTVSASTTTTTLGGRLFEADNPWHKDVSTLSKSASSNTIINALAAAGGWGFGSFRIDFSIEVLEANTSTPFRTFTKTGDFYTPDCDDVPVPVPPGGALEGESGYECTTDGDCHLIVVHRPTKTLYEMWRANIVGPTFFGGCLAKWDLTRAYPTTLRGDQCTSADAGGFPIAAMLFSADEVASGAINHAIRFILPNSRMRAGVYVRPATHAGGPSGGANLPPYGVRFRLRADYPLASLPTEGARVIARALQRYGMILSDGGNIALTAQSDRFTTHKWSEVGVDTRSLQAIQVSDMEVVDLGTPIPLTFDCVRNP